MMCGLEHHMNSQNVEEKENIWFYDSTIYRPSIAKQNLSLLACLDNGGCSVQCVHCTLFCTLYVRLFLIIQTIIL